MLLAENMMPVKSFIRCWRKSEELMIKFMGSWRAFHVRKVFES
jgi:hypothetical protein